MGDPLAEGDRVVLPWSVRGVLQRDFDGVGSPGETVEYSGLAMLRIRDGKIVEDVAFTEGFGSVTLGQTYKPG
jgi:predicted ester cyclase